MSDIMPTPLDIAWSVLKADPDARIYDGRFQGGFSGPDGMRHQTLHPGALAYMRRSGTEGPKRNAHIVGGPTMMTSAGTPEQHYGRMDSEGYVVPNTNRTVMNSVMADDPQYNSRGQRSDPSQFNDKLTRHGFGQVRHRTLQDAYQAKTPHEAMMNLQNMPQEFSPEEVAGMPTFQDSINPQIGNPDGVQMLPYGNQFIPDFRQQQLEEFANERRQDRLADSFYNGSMSEGNR